MFPFYPGSRRPRLRAETLRHFGVQARALPVDEWASVWPACLPQAGMSPHFGREEGDHACLPVGRGYACGAPLVISKDSVGGK